MYQLNDRITVDENICNGKPIIRGMRITVQTVLEFLFAGDTIGEILAHYPMLEEQDIDACKQFAIDMMNRSYSLKEVA
jgi:uncharacterized protein (DUF433 family)